MKYKACWDNKKWKWRRNLQKSFYIGDDNSNAYDKFSEASSESWQGTSKYLMQIREGFQNSFLKPTRQDDLRSILSTSYFYSFTLGSL